MMHYLAATWFHTVECVGHCQSVAVQDSLRLMWWYNDGLAFVIGAELCCNLQWKVAQRSTLVRWQQ
jgi:hypothetical protein